MAVHLIRQIYGYLVGQRSTGTCTPYHRGRSTGAVNNAHRFTYAVTFFLPAATVT